MTNPIIDALLKRIEDLEKRLIALEVSFANHQSYPFQHGYPYPHPYTPPEWPNGVGYGHSNIGTLPDYGNL